jgi:hypothetical protein
MRGTGVTRRRRGVRCWTAEARMGSGRRMAGEPGMASTTSCVVLGAHRKSVQSDDQRDRGETLHGDILRLFDFQRWQPSPVAADSSHIRRQIRAGIRIGNSG